MKMTLKRNELKDALTKVTPLKKGCMRGMSSFTLEAIPGETPVSILTGINPSIKTVVTMTDVLVSDAGKVRFSLDGIASEILLQGKAESIELSTEAQSIRIISGKQDSTIPTVAIEDIMEDAPEVSQKETYHMSADDFLSAVKKTSFICRGETSGEVTNCIALSFEDGKLCLMATDRKRISIINIPATGGAKQIVVLSEDALSALSHIVSTGSEIAMETTDKTVTVKCGNTETTVTKIAISYPQLMGMIPKTFTCTVSVPRADLVDSMKHMLVVNDSCLSLTFDGEKMLVSANSVLGKSVESHDVKSEKKFMVLFKPAFLIEPLETQKAEIVNLRFVNVEVVSAVSVSGDPDSLYLVMPQAPA